MTIDTDLCADSYVADGTANPRSIGFRILHPEDLIVLADGVEQIENLHYTVSGDWNAGTGIFTPNAVTPWAAGTEIFYKRATPPRQAYEIPAGIPLKSASVELELDRRAMIEAEHRLWLLRTVSMPDGEGGFTLPDISQRAGKLLVLGNDGTGVVRMLDGSDFKGNPGGNAMAIGRFAVASTIAIEDGYDLVRTSGHIADGTGSGDYTRDVAVDAAYVAANPYTAFLDTTGKGFRLAEAAVNTDMFGCDKTGATNTTARLLAFFRFCIATGCRGHIMAGTYLVDEGVLVFDTGGTANKPWPFITTDGHLAVTLKGSGLTDAPILSLSNGAQSSPVGSYWRGGCLGGLTFASAYGGAYGNRHGLSLQGCWGIRFGYLAASNLSGSTVVIPRALLGGNNPDPYGVLFCNFEAIEGNFNKGWAFENRNYLGFNANHITFFRSIQNFQGGWYGFGTGNTIVLASEAGSAGWAFDDGDAADATGGANLRFVVEQAELDNPQNGIRINRCTNFEFRAVRFNHRYNAGGRNPGEGYWPRTAMAFAGGVSPSIFMGRITAIHRIEAGGTKADMGVLLNLGGSPAVNDVDIDHYVQDNAGLGFTDKDYFASTNTTAQYVVRSRGRVVFDSRARPNVILTGTTAVSIPNSGYGTASAKVIFPNKRPASDFAGAYDAANGWYTVPYGGIYRMSGSILLAAASGTRVRLGLMAMRSGTPLLIVSRTFYAASANAQSYGFDESFDLLTGDQVFLVADQNTAAAIPLTVSILAAAENVWSIEAVGGS